MKYGTVYHIKKDYTNTIKQTRCGLKYGNGKGYHYEYAYPDGEGGWQTNPYPSGPIDEGEICRRCLKTLKIALSPR